MLKNLANVDRLMHWGGQQGVFSGAVLLIAWQQKILLLEGYGWANRYTRTPVHTETVFDLASLTKPLATALVVMHCVSEKRLTLDTCLTDAWPGDVPSDKAAISIAQLLEHTAGLPDYRPYYQVLAGHPLDQRRQLLHNLLVQEPLLAEPGKQVCYSDLGFMMLQSMVETCWGQPLNDLAEKLYRHLGISGLAFKASQIDPALEDIAATEYCFWRDRLLWGEVHDENAWILNGVAGHAGLFGTARAVYRLLELLLHRCQHHHSRNDGLDSDVVRTFFSRRASGRALGFDCPSRHHSSTGQYFSPLSIGHLGFTGTSFWVDPLRQLVVILLSNRVHPTRHNTAIRMFRPQLHDQIIKSLNLE